MLSARDHIRLHEEMASNAKDDGDLHEFVSLAGVVAMKSTINGSTGKVEEYARNYDPFDVQMTIMVVGKAGGGESVLVTVGDDWAPETWSYFVPPGDDFRRIRLQVKV